MAVPDDMKTKIRSVLLSKIGGCRFFDLNRDYKNLIGEPIHFKKLGFSSLEELVKSIPDVARIKNTSDGPKVFGILNNPNIRNHTARKAQYRPDVQDEELERQNDELIWQKELQPNLKGLYCLCMAKRPDLSREMVNQEVSKYGDLKETSYTERFIFLRFAEKDHALAALKGLSVNYDVRIPTEKNNPRRVIKEKDVTGEMPAYPVVKASDDRIVKSGELKNQLEVFIGNLSLDTTQHKKWEGDAVMVARGRSVSLMDMEGKEIGKGTGYKSSELQDLQDGNTLVIGGKEIEIMGTLDESDYKSGKCFNAAATKEEVPTAQRKSNVSSKPFLKPGKMSAGEEQPLKQQALGAVVSAKHDPSAPNALVLPRPGQGHQWENNKSSLPVVDVVVDPYLSQHLRPHQREGVLFLYQCIMGMKDYVGSGAILADEMGLGKTLQCICLIWTLLRQGPYGGKAVAKRVLIVTPGSLVKNWLKEFKKWLGTERLKVYAVTQDSKIDEFVHLPHFPVCIISYDMLVRTIDTVRQVKFDLVVCDEGHRLKNSNIKTTTHLNSLETRRRVILTGTPVQNDLQELYSIADFCNPGILGSAGAFRRVYEEPILAARQSDVSTDVKVTGSERAAELNRITSMFILRRTAEINNQYLPPKVELVLFCKPSALQLKLYNQLLHSCVVRSCLQSHDMGRHLMCISALRKLCNHPVLLYKEALLAEQEKSEENDEGDLYRDLIQHYPDSVNPDRPLVEHSGKLSVVDNMLAALHQTQPTERVVLVSNYTQTLDVLECLCNLRQYSYLRLDGQTPTAKRQQLVERFNSKYAQDFVFLLSCKAGGVGLNLIGASRLVLYDIDWNPANDLQAMARVWRDGQRQKVYIYRLLSTGTIEEKMYQRQVSKQGLSGIVVDSRSSNSKLCFSPDELRDLFKLQPDTVCATHDLLDCSSCESSSQQTTPGQVIARSCQLQKNDFKKQKNLCMDELLEWKHITGPSPDLTAIDPVINKENLSQVTFVFWNEVNNVKKEHQ